MKDSTFKRYCLIVDEWLVNGQNGTKAHQYFNKESSDENSANRFMEIVRISEVASYIKEKQSNKSDELSITLSSQLKLLSDIIGDKDARHTDKINAIKEQNKLLALYREHNEQKKGDSVTFVGYRDLSDSALKEILEIENRAK